MAYTQPMRINQYIALSGVCSRRQADRLIEEGQVLVNGAVATVGMRVLPFDVVTIGGHTVELPDKLAVYAYYKPRGIACTEADPHIPREQTLSYVVNHVLNLPVRVTYAGRLDMESEGLLLMTNDGRLSNAMMKSAHMHEKEYRLTLNKPVTKEFIRGMSAGVYLEELDITTRPCEVFADNMDDHVVTVILTQGLNRQLRRMCAVFDYGVERLVRTRVMNVLLDVMKPGDCREITGDERARLYKDCQDAASVKPRKVVTPEGVMEVDWSELL